jgi:hypothetical protein
LLEPDGVIWNIAKALSEKLIDVVIICDHPTKRHSSKRASCKAEEKQRKMRLNSLLQRLNCSCCWVTLLKEQRTYVSCRNRSGA